MWGTGLTLNMVLIPFLCSALSRGDRCVCIQKETRQICPCICKGDAAKVSEQKQTAHYFHRPLFPMRFNLAKEKHESLKEYFVALLHGGVRFDEFFALDDVSFDIMPGDFYGLIGLNGSGKSTLLKVISGVYKPSAGKVTVNGTIAPLIEEELAIKALG